ncbi:Cytochrome C oxidase, cbb3-type, subunit III [Persephonella hydrogeniphila]|uniref:Cytochrome C oxidase, cbb3-type, subunit III n=1 Tax=Persephonella hydrogeniphila TaxID=198703 RepID=A0A285NEQ4_9AQUI|nr:cytochrome c [Persephonella hydrogeniphila]SNZ07982.1 Cytochrome C oxidase, cbb3-type, subunit III [Persephonella hydrogeniphila]
MGENTAVKWILFFFFPALFIYGLLHVYSSKPAQAKRTKDLTAQEEAGRKVYNKFCVGCHGVNGDGNSEAAKFFKDKPPNFNTAVFRWKSTPEGTLPTDEDLMHVLNWGIPQTPMPSFKLVPEVQKRAVIAYIKTFSDRWQKEKPGESVYRHIKKPEWFGSPESIEKGKQIYATNCTACHGEQGRGDGPIASTLPVPPTDLTYPVRSAGPKPEDTFRVLTVGLEGSPMPKFDFLSEEDRWHLVSYIAYLMNKGK